MSILCLDFDGVIHSYASGWKGADIIPDGPVPGALMFLQEALQHFDVAIFSSRSHQPGGLKAMQTWLANWALSEMAVDEDLAWIDKIQWPLEKPAAFVTLDDRALTFDGTWPAIAALKEFKPWNKR